MQSILQRKIFKLLTVIDMSNYKIIKIYWKDFNKHKILIKVIKIIT